MITYHNVEVKLVSVMDDLAFVIDDIGILRCVLKKDLVYKED